MPRAGRPSTNADAGRTRRVRAARHRRLPPPRPRGRRSAPGASSRARLRAWHLPLTRTPPPARPRSSTSGCWPSWPRRSPWPRRRRGWRGCRRRSPGSSGPACASSAATSAGPPTRRRPGCAPCTLSDRAARRRARRHGAVGPGRRRPPVARGAALGRVGRGHEGRARRRRGERRARLRARPAEGGHRGRGRAAGRRRGRLGVPRRRDRAALPRRGALRALAARSRAGRPRGAPARPGWRPRAGPGSASCVATGRGRRRSARAASARPGIEVSAEAALGARIGRGSTTLYLRAETDGPAHDRRAGRAARRRARAGPSSRSTRATARARASSPSGSARAAPASTRSSRPSRGWTCASPPTARSPRGCCAIARRGRRRSPRTCARRSARRSARARWSAASTRSRTARARSSWPAALGAEVGVEAGYSKVDRRLVEASAWTAGSQERAREDCIA